MIIQGVCLTLTTLESDIFVNILASIYSLGLLIYLIYKIVRYYRYDDEDENKECDDKVHALDEAVVIESEQNKEVEEKTKVEDNQKVEINEPLAEEVKHDLQEELDETIVMADLENEIEAIPSREEELGKVVDLQDRKEKMAQAVETPEDLEITVIMPCITEADIKREKTRYESKNRELMIQAEPNFIAHLEKYLGDFEGIYKQIIPTEIPIDILHFSGEKYDAIVTNGMRAMVMPVPPELDDYKQVELMMFIDKSFSLSEGGIQTEESAWLITLLTDIALYPKQTNTYLGWGHIVGNGEELEAYDASVAYCGALIYPPMAQEDVRFYRYIEKDRNISIYNVMPLFKEELKFIQEHSSDQFVNLMSEMGVNQVIKPERLNIIKNMKRFF